MQAEEARVDPWQMLGLELDAWAASGRVATMWLRDDDASADGPKLRRLLETMGAAPVSLAVVPDWLQDSLPALLAAHPSVTVLQHGFAHVSHSAEGQKKSEFPVNRLFEAVAEDLAAGSEILEKAFGDTFRRVLAPPWNRFDPSHRPALERAGLRWLSTYGNPDAPSDDPVVLDTQVDPIFWRGHRGYLGDAPVLDRLIRHLATRRSATPGSVIDRPSGIMTHHIVHDEECWAFLSRLAATVTSHPAVAWVDPFDGGSAS